MAKKFPRGVQKGDIVDYNNPYVVFVPKGAIDEKTGSALANDAFSIWNDALSQKPGAVAAHYEPYAALVPTVSNEQRDDWKRIKDYFRDFCAKKPAGKIRPDSESMVIGDDFIVHNGVYDFTLGGVESDDGKPVVVPAHFTYVHRTVPVKVRQADGTIKDGRILRLVHHHSSALAAENKDHDIGGFLLGGQSHFNVSEKSADGSIKITQNRTFLFERGMSLHVGSVAQTVTGEDGVQRIRTVRYSVVEMEVNGNQRVMASQFSNAPEDPPEGVPVAELATARRPADGRGPKASGPAKTNG